MHPSRFDALSRLIAGGGSRRLLVASLLLGLAAPLLPRVGYRALAACKKVNQNCDRNSDCCAHAFCPSNKCRCRDGFRNCGNDCVDLDTDEDHCGGCDARCTGGERCCDGDCANLDTDPDHCGACGNECAAGEECFAGVCDLPSGNCPAGVNSCTEEPVLCGGRETCACLQSTEGTTHCGDGLTPLSTCGQCTSSEDCVEFGPGAFCALGEAPELCCGPGGQNFCRRACPPVTSGRRR